jgi:hypothetical protein
MARVIGIVTNIDRLLVRIGDPFGFGAEHLDLFVREAGARIDRPPGA